MRRRIGVFVAAALLLAGAGIAARRYLGSSGQAIVAAEPKSTPAATPAVHVDVVRPASGGILRRTVQPGSAHSFEHADLYAKVSGYLKTQRVDIGSRVKRGELLAEIDVPELAQELERDKVRLLQAEAEVVQADAQLGSVVAEHKAAQAYVEQTRAGVKRFESERVLREKEYQRIRELHDLNSVERRLVDEKFDHLQAAQAAELTAQRTVFTAEQEAASAQAKIVRAKADLQVAKAKVRVVQAEVTKTQLLVSYTRIVSPYDGVVTHRSFHPGDFIRSADQGSAVPILSVDRTDLMRIVVQVPDRDVPFTQPGDICSIHFDALPTETFSGRIARVSSSEDRQSRTMRAEFDVPNPRGIIHNGMYGQVEIELEETSAGVTIPSACLVGNVNAGRVKVLVVADGKVKAVEVEVGKDTGAIVEVKSGLTIADQVILKPRGALVDGTPVNAATVIAENAARH